MRMCQEWRAEMSNTKIWVHTCVCVCKWKGKKDACVSVRVQDIRACIKLSVYCIVCMCVWVCGPTPLCAGGQNTRDCFDLDSLCLVQSQSCHWLPTAGATHSWRQEGDPASCNFIYVLQKLCSQNVLIHTSCRSLTILTEKILLLPRMQHAGKHVHLY